MPTYEFLCPSCGLLFEKFFRSISKASDTAPCFECQTEAKKVPSAASFSFNHSASQLRGAAPPSTGTSDDWSFDKAIGRDAEKKWAKVEEREGVKSDHIRGERKAGKGVTRDHLVPSAEGYRTITEPERISANEKRQAAFAIAKAAKEKS